MLTAILGGVGGVITPIATNLINKVFGLKEKQEETKKTFSENDVKLAQIAADAAKSENEFEIERMKTIAQTTSNTGNPVIDAMNNGVRVVIGLCAAVIIIASTIGYYSGNSGSLISPDGLEAIVAYIVGYYFAARSCKKTF
ncbi:MAG: holin family protein [Elusimicrobiota bacterium]|jgi:hypothetical protein|nr:holin family protein [Elusimicrobiota bacterium]